jgi:flavin-dependent dehydrogenase
MRRAAALIVGGGPAGSAAAIALARAGAAPLLVERRSAPQDVVCGGFLGWDALAALERLGVDPWALGARPIERLRLVAGRKTAEAALPRRAAGLSRRTLDEAMLGAAAEAGAEVLRGRSVRHAEPHVRQVRLDDDQWVEAESLFLATGKHELRGAPRIGAAIDKAPVGLRASVAVPEGLDGWIELHLFDGGYAGLLVQEDGSANLCLSVSRERLRAAGGVEALAGMLLEENPALAERVGGGVAGGWSAVAGVPYGWRERETEPGVFRIGDRGAVIASLAGDGIAIALASAAHAAAAFVSHGPDGAWHAQRSFSARAARPVEVAEALRWAAERRLPRKAMMGVLRAFPGLAPLAARLTRIA